MANLNLADGPKAWQVQRYCRREGSTWVTVDNGTGIFTLHLKAGYLMLIQSGIVLESLPLSDHTQIHAIIKSDTLLIGVRHQNTGRKFKVRFTSVHSAQDCMKSLQRYFPVKDVTKPEENIPIPMGEMYQRLMTDAPGECLPNPEPIPSSFPLAETLQMCILDPTFPELVAKVADILADFDIGRGAK